MTTFKDELDKILRRLYSTGYSHGDAGYKGLDETQDWSGAALTSIINLVDNEYISKAKVFDAVGARERVLEPVCDDCEDNDVEAGDKRGPNCTCPQYSRQFIIEAEARDSLRSEIIDRLNQNSELS